MQRHDRRLARAVYAMVLMAVLTLVLAEGAVVYFALACLAALISWPIAHGRSGQSAVPRWLIAIAVMLAMAFFLYELVFRRVDSILALGHAMILVEVCKFFETKRSRDYGQLIVLSMLQMIAGAIISSSIIFGAILIAYVALGIYTLLLFHFGREMELFERIAGQGRMVVGQRASLRPAPGALETASRSLDGMGPGRFWRLGATAGAFSLALGVILFMAFPRVSPGWLGGAELMARARYTGFSDNPTLQAIGPIKENDEVAMWVTEFKDGHSVAADGPLLLRGSVAWRYQCRRGGGQWDGRNSNVETFPSQGRRQFLHNVQSPAAGGKPPAERELRIDLVSMSSRYLFSPYAPVGIKADSPKATGQYQYDPVDRTLQTDSQSRLGVHYTVWFTADPGELNEQSPPPRTFVKSSVPDSVVQLARKWTAGQATDLDKANAIRDHLLAEYRYTLNPVQKDEALDSLTDFLLNTKAGHCQFFASAFTVLCQQLNIPARLVNGFQATEFNPQGDHYIVRHKHAHSWSEAYITGRGWLTFNPTPAAGDESFKSPTGIWGWLSHSFDYLHYKWQQRVLNFSGQDRKSLIVGLANQLEDVGQGLLRLPPWWTVFISITAVILLAVRALWRPRGRWSAWVGRRRAKALRQSGLGFWADLLAVLDRNRLAPHAALTPLEVANGLARVLPEVPGLPQLALAYYKLRYGPGRLSADEQTMVRHTISRVSATLAAKPKIAAQGIADSGFGV